MIMPPRKKLQLDTPPDTPSESQEEAQFETPSEDLVTSGEEYVPDPKSGASSSPSEPVPEKHGATSSPSERGRSLK